MFLCPQFHQSVRGIWTERMNLSFYSGWGGSEVLRIGRWRIPGTGPKTPPEEWVKNNVSKGPYAEALLNRWKKNTETGIHEAYGSAS